MTLTLLLSLLTVSAAAQDGKYPTVWDITLIYPDIEAWEKDYAEVMEEICHHEDYRGRLNNAQTICEYIERFYVGDLSALQNKLYIYAYVTSEMYPNDSKYKRLLSLLDDMNLKELQYSSWVAEELSSMPLEERIELFSDPLLETYAYYFSEYTDPDTVIHSEETNNAIGLLATAWGQSSNIYDILSYIDMPHPLITLPDGSEEELTKPVLDDIVGNKDYSQDFKLKAAAAFDGKYEQFIDVYAALFEGTITENWALAQLDGYDSSLEAALSLSDLKPEVYEQIINTAHDGIEQFHRYVELHKKAGGLQKQYLFDLESPSSDFGSVKHSFDEGIDRIRKALSILGEDYIAYFDELVTGGYMDVYPREFKSSGAYSIALGNIRPFQSFNYVGYAGDLETLAHELGHGIYSCFAQDNQPIIYTSPDTFTQEVASTTNELLYGLYCIENASSDEEKLFYLEALLNNYTLCVFRECLYAEFEDWAYKTVEEGYILDADSLNSKWLELTEQYYGEDLSIYPEMAYHWAYVSHFQLDHYVYMYATAAVYAMDIAQRILNEEEGALEQYKDFLKRGGSAAAHELLLTAGVDIYDSETYANSLVYFSSLLDEYEELIELCAAD